VRAGDVHVGRVYLARVSGRVVRLGVERRDEAWTPPVGAGWKGRTSRRWVWRDETTGREVVVRSAQRFLAPRKGALS